VNAVFPAAAALIALACAGVVGWDARRWPRPERIVWFVAFLVFFLAAAAEVVGAVLGWSPALARIYYLAGAVLVVGLLALGEAYLLWPARMPAATPGIALLIVAVAATVVWSAPVDAAALPEIGWHALERGPALVALAVGINAGGTLVLVGGALYSALRLRAAAGSRRRAVGCVLIAAGAVMVAMGGTLTRLGRPEYLYVAMAAGIAVIFGGVLLTRPRDRRARATAGEGDDEGVRFIVEKLLPLESGAIADVCRRWSAAPIDGEALTREQARQTWALRVLLPDADRDRFDDLPLTVQAQLADLHRHVWSGRRHPGRNESGPDPRRALAILRPASEAEGEAR
jgi:hypothetical protein